MTISITINSAVLPPEVSDLQKSCNFFNGGQGKFELLWSNPSTSCTLAISKQLPFLASLPMTKRRLGEFEFGTLFVSFSPRSSIISTADGNWRVQCCLR